MKKLIKFIIFPIVLILFACTCAKNIHDKAETYKYFNSQTSIKLEDILPFEDSRIIQKSDFSHAIYPNGIYAIGYSAYFVGFIYSTQEFDEKYNYIKSICKTIKSTDTVNFISPTQKCFEDNILPNMKDEFNNPRHYMDERSTFYLYKNDRGRFLNNEFLSYYSKSLNIQHGYQSGALIDEKSKKIVYWVLIW